MSRPRRDTLSVDVPPVSLAPTASPPLPPSSGGPVSPVSPLQPPSPIITATPAPDQDCVPSPTGHGHSRTASLAASLASHAESRARSGSLTNSLSGSRSSRPGSISLPPTPGLIPDAESARGREFDTNALALILPHPSLFYPEALGLLRRHFERFGGLTHFAPIRAMGRVIMVFDSVEAAHRVKETDDYLKLEVDISPNPIDDTADSGGYFDKKQKGLVLRLYALPPQNTSAPDHLKPPEHERNFLISPPGSPPEGWEPIAEDGPNSAPLADDLRRALEALQFSSTGSGPNVILDEGGVTVSVEDMDAARKPDWDEEREWGEEEPLGGPDIWNAPGQGMGVGTPRGRIAPTARPPM